MTREPCCEALLCRSRAVRTRTFHEPLTERSTPAGKNDSAEVPSAHRTLDQTRIGIFWGYDGGFRIGVPPRLYNSIADDVLIDALTKGDRSIATGLQLVRVYAMLNVALGDAGVSVCFQPCCSLPPAPVLTWRQLLLPP